MNFSRDGLLSWWMWRAMRSHSNSTQPTLKKWRQCCLAHEAHYIFASHNKERIMLTADFPIIQIGSNMRKWKNGKLPEIQTCRGWFSTSLNCIISPSSTCKFIEREHNHDVCLFLFRKRNGFPITLLHCDKKTSTIRQKSGAGIRQRWYTARSFSILWHTWATHNCI